PTFRRCVLTPESSLTEPDVHHSTVSVFCRILTTAALLRNDTSSAYDLPAAVVTREGQPPRPPRARAVQIRRQRASAEIRPGYPCRSVREAGGAYTGRGRWSGRARRCRRGWSGPRRRCRPAAGLGRAGRGGGAGGPRPVARG